MTIKQHTAALADNFSVIITHFDYTGERWLTTGEVDVYHAEDPSHAQALADLHGGRARSVYVGNISEEGQSRLHETLIVWEQPDQNPEKQA